jgi:putative transposase
VSSVTFKKWRAKYGGVDVSMMYRTKELEEENRRLKKVYVEEKLRAEIVSETLEKSGEAISQKRDGQEGGRISRRLHMGCLCGV